MKIDTEKTIKLMAGLTSVLLAGAELLKQATNYLEFKKKLESGNNSTKKA